MKKNNQSKKLRKNRVLESQLKMVREEAVQEEEKKGNKKYLLLLLLFLFFIGGITITFAVKPVRDKIEEIIIDTFHLDKPSAPEITGGSIEWAKRRVIYIKKDAHSNSGIAYYQYCVTKEKNTKNCDWKRTDTKNTVVSQTGKYSIYFRGVSKKNKIGTVSNREEAYIDNNAPKIEKIELAKVGETEAEIKFYAKDHESGIKRYLYRLDDREWRTAEALISLKDLIEDHEYQIEIRVEDQVENFQTVKVPFQTLKKEEEKKPAPEEELLAPTYRVTPSLEGWSSYKMVEILYPKGVEKEYSLDHGKTWKKYTGPVLFTKKGTIIGRSKKNKKTKAAEEIAIDFIDEAMPEIDLNDVPVEFVYGESYALPSHVKFGKSGGEATCTIEEKTYTNTKTIGVGPHTIRCVAKGNNGLEARVEKEIKVVEKPGTEEVWAGWITMNLYYPEESTERMWRIGKANEIRDGKNQTGWQEYTGPITVRIRDVENIYVKYKLGKEEVIVPPAGRLLVDIAPTEYEVKEGRTTLVQIQYDQKAKTREYKINDSEWIKYTGSFRVGPKTVIEARASAEEKVYDSQGDYVETRPLMGTDAVYIDKKQELVPEPTPTPSPSVAPSSSPNPTPSTTPTTKPTTDPTTSPSPSTTPTPTTSPTTSPSPSISPSPSPSASPTESPKPDEEEVEKPEKPSFYLEGPVIDGDPKTITEKVMITVTPQEEARDIYIKVGEGKYEKYQVPVEVTENITVQAYYVRKADGMTSDTSTYQVQNIKKGNLPYVRIDANPSPYLTKKTEQVEVEITGRDYETLEYSLDGIKYQTYTSQLLMTRTGVVYAKGENKEGTTIEKLYIDHIVEDEVVTPPVRPIKLNITITANPEATEKIIDQTMITIDYDERATTKQYRIGSGPLLSYTGPFEVNENTVIYAYASGENAKGETSRNINFLKTGIAAPEIIPSLPNNKPAESINVSIEYDPDATEKMYKIGFGPWTPYTGPFTVSENTVIKAYNTDVLRHYNESSYTVENIVPPRPPVIIEKDSYFLLKLNYPTDSKGRVYKWTSGGEWTPYKEDGILLVKKAYEEELMNKDGLKVQIEDENGNKINFQGDVYVVTVPFEEIVENIFMKWDVAIPSNPVIHIAPEEPTKKVEVTIDFDQIVETKYYKFIDEEGNTEGWKEYKGSFKVEKNGTVFAKGVTTNGIETKVERREIENIDSIPPIIVIRGDLETPKNKVTLLVEVSDNLKVGKIKWAKGKKDSSYFKEIETIENNSTVVVEENGTYTFYATDAVGNETVFYQEVMNIDKTKPEITIEVLAKKKGTSTKIRIDYGNSIVKDYHFGEEENWKSYTSELEIDSYEVIKNNWKNEDGSFTIYATGENAAGNVETVKEKIYILDLEIPKEPVIRVVEAGYPVLSLKGITLNQKVGIDFDTLEGIKNYYSLDEGATWKEYTGPFDYTEGKVVAKSVKETGMEVKSETTIELPRDALRTKAYDKDMETGAILSDGHTKLYIDTKMWGQEFSGMYKNNVLNSSTTITFYNKENQVIKTESGVKETELTNYHVTIPVNTAYLMIQASDCELKEIMIDEELDKKHEEAMNQYRVPFIQEDNYNWTESKKVTINYGQDFFRNEYSLDFGATWSSYSGEIHLTEPKTIFARILDGEDYLTASSYTVAKIDTVEPAIDLNNLPEIFQVKSNYSLPSHYTIGGSGSIPVCMINGKEYTSTKDLVEGDYTVSCSISNVFGKKVTVEKSFKIRTKVSNLISERPFEADYWGDLCKTYDDGVDTFLVGQCKNNYVWYSGKLWRIVLRNNETGAVKMVTDNNMTSIPMNRNSTNPFNSSYVDQWLQQEFLPTLHDSEKYLIVDSQWNEKTSSQVNFPARPEDSSVITRPIGLLSTYEYSTTYTKSDGMSTEESNYLNNRTSWWTMTPYDSTLRNYIGKNGTIMSINSGVFSTGVRPTVNLKENIVIISGSGTGIDPYRVQGDKKEYLNGKTLVNTRYIGEYVKFNNELYRIVNVENGMTKIFSLRVPEELKKIVYSSSGSLYAGSNMRKQLINYYSSLSTKYKDMIDKNGRWYYTGIYHLMYSVNYKAMICQSVDINISTYDCVKSDNNYIDEAVGTLRYGEMLLAQNQKVEYTTIWIITQGNNYRSTTFGANGVSDGMSSQQAALDIKPSMYLKSNVVIAKNNTGDGTYEHPYDIELLEE